MTGYTEVGDQSDLSFRFADHPPDVNFQATIDSPWWGRPVLRGYRNSTITIALAALLILVLFSKRMGFSVGTVSITQPIALGEE